jgi:peptidoglycan/xylan/chitin deacetylase (PgdA/CDA1 family)
MSIGWTAGLRRRAGHFLRPGGRAVILLYHRIADDPADPYGLCVTPRHFDEHLEAIRGAGRPMALRELASAMRTANVPDDAICITFDDGYIDNLHVAKPLLARHDVPATVFMTTGRAGRDREFWWDELQRAFFEPVELPAEIEVSVAGGRRAWSFGPDAKYPEDDPRRRIAWHVHDEHSPTMRHAAFREAYMTIQPLPQAERSRVLDGLLTLVGISAADVRDSRRALEPDQMVDLVGDGLVDVGAHTVSHPAMPAQPRAVQHEEAARSKADLEAWLDGEIEGFAYPYGQYDDVSVGAVREAGFAWACSCDGGPARRDTDLHVLPRLEVMECDGDRLAEMLAWELHGRRPRARSHGS